VSPAGNVFMTIVYSKHPSEPRMLFPIRVLKYIWLDFHAGALDQSRSCSDRLGT
jgi:hypothetical protein